MAGWKKVLLTNSEATETSNVLTNMETGYADFSPFGMNDDQNPITITDQNGSGDVTAADVFSQLDVNVANPLVLRMNDSGDIAWGKGSPDNVIVGAIVDGSATELSHGNVPMVTALTADDSGDGYAIMDSAISATSSTAAVTGTLGVTGLLNADGGIAVDSNKFTVADSTGNTAIAGTLSVTGVGTFTAQSVHTGGIRSGENIVSDTNSTDDLGTVAIKWANVYTDSIGNSGDSLGIGAETVIFADTGTIATTENATLALNAGSGTLAVAAGATTVSGTLGVTGTSNLNTTNITGTSGSEGSIIHTNIGYTTDNDWTTSTKDAIALGAFTNLDATNLTIDGDLEHTGNSAIFADGALSIKAAGSDTNGLTVNGTSMGTSVSFDGSDYISVKNNTGSSITLNNDDGLMYLALDDGGVAAFYFSESDNDAKSAADLVIAAGSTDSLYITTTDASWDLDTDDDYQTFTATAGDPKVIYTSEPEKDQVVFSDSCFIDGGATIIATTNFSTEDSFMNINASASNNANFSTAGTGGIVFGYDQGGAPGNEFKGGKLVSNAGGYFDFLNLKTDEANATSTVAYQDNATGSGYRPISAKYLCLSNASKDTQPITQSNAIAVEGGNLYFYK